MEMCRNREELPSRLWIRWLLVFGFLRVGRHHFKIGSNLMVSFVFARSFFMQRNQNVAFKSTPLAVYPQKDPIHLIVAITDR